MSLLTHLQLQPVDVQEDGSISELDRPLYDDTDIIDLSSDDDGTDLIEMWSHIEDDIHG